LYLDQTPPTPPEGARFPFKANSSDTLKPTMGGMVKTMGQEGFLNFFGNPVGVGDIRTDGNRNRSSSWM